MEFINLIIALSTFFVYWDCTRNHIGKNSTEKGLLNNSAGVWAIGTTLLWIVVFPLYLINRTKLKQKAIDAPQIVPPLRRNFTLGVLVIISALVIVGQFSSIVIPDDNSLLSDVSGVWKASDGTIVVIDFEDSLDQKIQFADTAFPVTISQVDLSNDAVVVTVARDDIEKVWTIQKVIEPDESFQLLITLGNGVQDQLTFGKRDLNPTGQVRQD